jgi:secreted PhoX family phosphatase
VKRREFLRMAGGAAVGAAASSSLWTRAAFAHECDNGTGPYGPLQSADANGLQLPAGFSSRIVAMGDVEVGDTGYTWHRVSDGAAMFNAPGGYIYTSNSERTPGGGVSAIRFDYRGRILDAYSICSGTNHNCAGGATPWNTWLTCEEVNAGRVWECDPFGVQSQIVRPAMGTFKHEAVAVDPVERRMYLTEDVPDGCFYRFTPDTWGDLSSGVLEVARNQSGNVTWYVINDPDGSPTATRHQVSQATHFNGGEGCVNARGRIFFTTKGDNRVWDYDPINTTMSILYEYGQDPGKRLSGVDNIGSSRSGDLLVAEDGGNLELVILSADPVCTASPFLRITGQSGTEVAGPAFDPLGRRLYVASQNGGPSGQGTIYEITGPFRRMV